MASLRPYGFRVVAVFLFLASLFGQEAPTLHKAPASSEAEAPSVHVDVKEVTVPVTVRDKHGKLVQDLSKDDFTLLQDTKPQTITNLRHETNLPLTVGLLVDTSRSMSNELSAEKSASQKFLDEMLKQSNDQAFLIHFDKEVELLQDLTSSRDKLYTALGLLETDRSDSAEDSVHSDGDDRGSRRRHRTQLYDAVYLASTEILKKQTGRKALVILSDGQDRGSKETLNDAIEYAQRADTTVYAIYFKGEEQQRRGFGDREGGRGGMGGPRIGLPGGGGGYPGGGGGYPGGGRRGGREPEEPRVDGKKILTEIATKTGGQMFEVSKKESVEQIYSEIAEELRDQVVLAYTPDKSSTESGYHRITLAAKNKDLKVQAREGFYIPEQTEASK